MAAAALVAALSLGACGVEDLEVVAPETPSTGAASSTSGSTGSSSTASTDTTSTSSTSTSTTEVPTTTTTAAPTTTTTEPPTTTSTSVPAPDAADASLAFVNQKRAENGRATLFMDPELTTIAYNWAQQMAADGHLRHNPQVFEQVPDRYRTAGENVGFADAGAAAIDQGWWNSEGHRENMLRESFDAVGIAFVTDANGRTWGVQVYGGD